MSFFFLWFFYCTIRVSLRWFLRQLKLNCSPTDLKNTVWYDDTFKRIYAIYYKSEGSFSFLTVWHQTYYGQRSRFSRNPLRLMHSDPYAFVFNYNNYIHWLSLSFQISIFFCHMHFLLLFYYFTYHIWDRFVYLFCLDET